MMRTAFFLVSMTLAKTLIENNHVDPRNYHVFIFLLHSEHYNLNPNWQYKLFFAIVGTYLNLNCTTEKSHVRKQF